MNDQTKTEPDTANKQNAVDDPIPQAVEPKSEVNEADHFRALERLRKNKSNCFAF